MEFPIEVVTGDSEKLLEIAGFLAKVYRKINPVSKQLGLTEEDLFESKKPSCNLPDTSGFIIRNEKGNLLAVLMCTPLKNMVELSKIPSPPTFVTFDKVAEQCPIPQFLYEHKTMFLFGLGKLPNEEGGISGVGLPLCRKAIEFAKEAGFDYCCACLSSEASQNIFLNKLNFSVHCEIAYSQSNVPELVNFPGDYIVVYKNICNDH